MILEMNRTEYKQVKESANEMLKIIPYSNEVVLYHNENEIYKEYYRFVSIWFLWIDQIIKYNEDFELCYKIKQLIELERQSVIRSAIYSGICPDDLDNMLQNVEDIAYYNIHNP